MSIRIATCGDLPQMLEIYAPYVLKTAVSFEYTVPTIAEFTRRFQTITRQFPWLVWEENGKVLGYAYGSAPFERAAYAWCAEASIYLHPQIQGQGIGKRMYRVLEAILAAQGYRKLYAIVTTQNAASVAFHQAVGYRLLAVFPGCGIKFGQVHGINWLEKDLNSDTIPITAPLSASAVVKNDENFAKILDKITLF